jgi:hypothetical protein
MPAGSVEHVFILSAFDHHQWCPVLQTRFFIRDLGALASIVGDEAKDDPELRGNYILDDADLAAIRERFGAALDVAGLACAEPAIFLFRPHRISTAPYLVHTGYELPLLLDGRKKLARMSEPYPPDRFLGEDRFDRWVTAGALHKEVVDERFDQPHGAYLGVRTVYYTVPGEEWRIPAMKMILAASARTGGWNEYFERLEGMLFGYSDKENDWWIDIGLSNGGFDGIALCCAVDSNGLAWVEAAGFRALPPAKEPTVRIESYDGEKREVCRSLLAADEGFAAVLMFKVHGRHLLDLVDLKNAGPWDLPSAQIPILNRHLRGAITILARRSDGFEIETPAPI